MTKLSDYVMRRVAETGVRDVFLLPGGGCMHLVDSLGREKRLRFICNLHEQAAAVAADAYSQYTGNLGVALVTTGPGGTNAVTGVAGSWLDSIPTLILSGQVKRPDLLTGRGVRQMGFQEINIIDIVRPITKYAMLIDDPRSIRYHFDKADLPSQARPAGAGSARYSLGRAGRRIGRGEIAGVRSKRASRRPPHRRPAESGRSDSPAQRRPAAGDPGGQRRPAWLGRSSRS